MMPEPNQAMRRKRLFPVERLPQRSPVSPQTGFMALTERASRRAAFALLTSAACGSLAGVLVAASAPPRESPIVFVPLVAVPIGVIVAGHLSGRALLAWLVLAPSSVIGWFVSFAATSGVFPSGLFVALCVAIAAALYPLDRNSTGLLLISALIVGALSIVTVMVWVTDTAEGRLTASALASGAMLTFLAAALLPTSVSNRPVPPRRTRESVQHAEDPRVQRVLRIDPQAHEDS